MKWRFVLGLALLTALGRSAEAHSYQIYVSTPVSPPQGFTWVFYAAMVLFVAVAALGMKIAGSSWIGAWVKAAVVVGFFAVCFYHIGATTAEATTGPRPGLGWGRPIYWGFGWGRVGRHFVKWNLLGLSIFAFAAALLAGRAGRWLWLRGCGLAAAFLLALSLSYAQYAWLEEKAMFHLAVGLLLATTAVTVWRKRRWVAPIACAGVYCAALAPFLVTSAYSHGGWGGGYVAQRCEDNIRTLYAAVARFARAHGDRLPSAETAQDVLNEMRPYLDLPQGTSEQDILICGMGAALDRHPTPYRWNARLSGKTIEELKGLKPPPQLFVCEYATRGCAFARRFSDQVDFLEEYQKARATRLRTETP